MSLDSICDFLYYVLLFFKVLMLAVGIRDGHRFLKSVLSTQCVSALGVGDVGSRRSFCL